jgi:hypothetical protein
MLMQVVEAEEDAIGEPVCAAEHATHTGQQDAAEQQLLAEHRVE